MTSDKPIYVAFLWHMHQPWYIWNEEGESALPWVRLHTIKDYYDMPKLLEDTGFPATINFVPSLLKQIELIATGKTYDSFWEAIIPEMNEMDESKLNIVVTHLFDANFDRFIKESPRYMELYAKRGKSNDWRLFSPQDIRDIQVHFILAWMGQSLRELPEVKKLIIKDSDYTSSDKNLLLDLVGRRISETIPYIKKLWDENKIALTYSPYYHPILPLLCDLTLSQKANPTAKIPNKPYFYPADASRQVKIGGEYFEKLFGRIPEGIWPPEGGVADEILSIFIESGAKYFFTDEEILRKSLEISLGEQITLTPTKLYTPYRIFRGRKNISVFFRDKKLSDKIGFVYYSWAPEDAADDFVNSLMRIRDALPNDDKDYIVSIILDGENAWEYYKDNGKPFLSSLYKKLLEHPNIIPITFEEYLKRHDDLPILDRIAPGSWINGDFSTWCGVPEKNRAWELLSEARSNFQLNADRLSQPIREKIMHYISVAEGSDWFWWFGETNYTPYLEVFDSLFRHQLKQVYKLMDENIPEQLEEPVHIIKHAIEPVRKPIQFMTPSLEGKTTTYFEWSAAGFYKASGFRGTMYSSKSYIISRLFFGFNLENLYLRLDSKQNLRDFFAEGGNISLEFLEPSRMEIVLFFKNDTLKWKVYSIEKNEKKIIENSNIEAVCEQIVEMKIPFKTLGADSENPIKFIVYVREDSILEQRFPPCGQYMEIALPDEDFEDSMWYV